MADYKILIEMIKIASELNEIVLVLHKIESKYIRMYTDDFIFVHGPLEDAIERLMKLTESKIEKLSILVDTVSLSDDSSISKDLLQQFKEFINMLEDMRVIGSADNMIAKHKLRLKLNDLQ